MKEIIEHLKEYWKTYVAFCICLLCLMEHVYLDNWQAAVYSMIIFFLLSALFELDKAYKRLRKDLGKSKTQCAKQNTMLRELHDKYAELGTAYIRLRKKYEPEELAKEIAKEYVPKKRRSRRWQNINTQKSK